MNRPTTAVFAALEALLVVGIGVGIALVPLTFLWAFQYGLQVDWTVFWRASVDVWLLGHGADVMLTLDPVTAAALGFDGAGTPFVISIAALGIALLTMLLALRAGRRIVETPYARLGGIVAILVFALLALGATLSALHDSARPSVWQGTLLPTFVFACGLLVGGAVARHRLARMPGRAARTPAAGVVASWWAERSPLVRTIVAEGLRGGAAAVAGLVTASAILLTVLLVVGYGNIIALYEGIHSGLLGGIAVTLGELAFLPNLVVWTCSWLVGPGFAIGTGSSVGPLGTSLGPLPAIPVLGALPSGELSLGFLGLVVPIVVGFLVGVVLRPRVVAAGGQRPGAALLATGLGVGIAAGVLLGLLAWVSGGAAGPGRLADVGPDALLVGLFAAVEVGIPAVLGLLVGRPARGA
jgi:hypothetical protein